MHTPKLTVLEKVGFGAGDMAVNVVISSMFLIVAYFYTDIFGLKPTHMGVLSRGWNETSQQFVLTFSAQSAEGVSIWGSRVID